MTPLGQCDLVRITPSSSSFQKLSSERPSSDGEGVMENGVTVCNGKEQGEFCPKQKPESETLRPVLRTLAAGTSPWRFGHASVTVLVALTDPRRPSGEQEPSEAPVPTAGPGFLWPDGAGVSLNRWLSRHFLTWFVPGSDPLGRALGDERSHVPTPRQPRPHRDRFRDEFRSPSFK